MSDEKNYTAETENEDTVMFQERKRILFFGLPWTFTKYTITPSMLTINQGFFRTQEDDCYLYKIQDVKLVTTLTERMFGLGTIICYTGDVTDREIRLIHVKHSKDIKNYLLKASETARLKRRTLSTMDIGARGLDLDHDGEPDSFM